MLQRRLRRAFAQCLAQIRRAARFLEKVADRLVHQFLYGRNAVFRELFERTEIFGMELDEFTRHHPSPRENKIKQDHLNDGCFHAVAQIGWEPKLNTGG
jgi:hypothetical protein